MLRPARDGARGGRVAPLVAVVPLVVVLVAVGLFVRASTREEQGRLGVFDGRARYPSEEGVVVDVSRARIVLDGGRTYPFASDVSSFSTYSGEPASLFERRNQYVHVGIEDGRVTWVAGIGSVFRGDRPVVYYNGDLVTVDGARRAVFRDGTVLRLAEGLPWRSGPVRAEIDVTTRLVRALTRR